MEADQFFNDIIKSTENIKGNYFMIEIIIYPINWFHVFIFMNINRFTLQSRNILRLSFKKSLLTSKTLDKFQLTFFKFKCFKLPILKWSFQKHPDHHSKITSYLIESLNFNTRKMLVITRNCEHQKQLKYKIFVRFRFYENYNFYTIPLWWNLN